jgi:crossover junction endodeoxyribonuclease RuvC
MERVILGIDPGTTVMGYGIIKINGKTPELLAIGVLKLSKLDNHYEKLSKIFERTASLIDEYHVSELAIESPFFGKNVQSMLKLGRAQGSAIAAALTRKISINEYAPLKIKQSITGVGNASKEQVAFMLLKMFKLDAIPEYLDATDALGAAVCHFLKPQKTLTKTPNSKKKNDWKTFIKNNSDRIK